ncbi:MAG: glycosyltransferase, partial [Alphaproteobacteria bacterium]
MKNKVILFTVNVDWFFLSHRLNLATEALKNGYEVHLAASFTDHKSHIESLGIHVHDLDIPRGNTSVLNVLLSIISIFKIVRLTSPDIIHAITLKVSIISAIASVFHRRTGLIVAISGLGYMYTEKSFVNSIKKGIIYFFFQLLAMRSNLKLIFQ